MVRVLDKWEDYEKQTIHFVMSDTCYHCGVYHRSEHVFSMLNDPDRTLKILIGCPNCYRLAKWFTIDPPLYFKMPSIQENRGAIVGKIIWVQ